MHNIKVCSFDVRFLEMIQPYSNKHLYFQFLGTCVETNFDSETKMS